MNKIYKEAKATILSAYPKTEFKESGNKVNIVEGGKTLVKLVIESDTSVKVISTDGSGRESFAKSPSGIIAEFSAGYSISHGEVCSLSNSKRDADC